MFQELQQWKAQRLGKFTASCIGELLQEGRKKSDLFGTTALTYIHDKIAEIITGQEKEEITGARAIEWGHQHEHEAIDAYREATGLQVEHYGNFNPQFFQYNAFAGGSPDGLIERTRPAEVKCPYNSAVHMHYLLACRRESDPAAWLKGFNLKYYCQLQFNALCLKLREPQCAGGVFISYDPRPVNPDHRLAYFDVPEDLEVQKLLVTRLQLAVGLVTDALRDLQRPTIALASAGPAGSVIVEPVKP